MEKTEALLDLVVLSPLTADGMGSPLVAGPIRVDKDNLDELLDRTAPGLRISLTSGSTEVEFHRFRDFRPEHLAETIPSARALLNLRGLLSEAARGKGDPRGLREAILSIQDPPELREAVVRVLHHEQGTPPGSPSPAPPRPTPAALPKPASPGDPGGSRDAIDGVLDMVDISGSRPGGRETPDAPGPGPTEKTVAQEQLDRLVRELVGPRSSGPGIPSSAITELETEVDTALGTILRGALRDPEFRALTTAWLGLRFLVRRIDFRSGVRVHALAISRAELARTMREIVLPFVETLHAEGRVACILLDGSFGDAEAEISLLLEISLMAESTRVPVIAAGDPSIIGLESLSGIRTLPNLADVLDARADRGWNGLRSQEATGWLVLTVNRFLMRPPFGKDAEPVKGFEFEEDADGAGFPLWGRGPWILGALIAASFERTGWGVEITGASGAGVVQDLPVRAMKLHTAEIVQAPLEVLLPENRVLELSQSGLTALVCKRNDDHVFVVTAPSVYRPEPAGESRLAQEDARRATLPYHLFLAQVAVWTESIWRWIDSTKPPEEIARTVASGLAILSSSSRGPVLSVHAEIARREQAPGQVLRLRLEPQGDPIRGYPPFLLELPLGSD